MVKQVQLFLFAIYSICISLYCKKGCDNSVI